MKVLELKTREIIETNESYGARLIEQGRAILPPEAKKPEPVTGDMRVEDAEPQEPAKPVKKR